MTLAEYNALPEDTEAHYELQSGALVVSPRAVLRHQQAMYRLPMAVEEQLPADAEWQVGADYEVVVQAEEPVTLRAPDVVVVRADTPQQRAAAGTSCSRSRSCPRDRATSTCT